MQVQFKCHSMIQYVYIKRHVEIPLLINKHVIVVYNQGRALFILFCVFRVLPEDDVNQARQNISAYSVVTL